jgi:hypothetical protein
MEVLDMQELINILQPECCGSRMKMMAEGIRFVEVMCKKCGDVIYLRKEDECIPQLIDD